MEHILHPALIVKLINCSDSKPPKFTEWMDFHIGNRFRLLPDFQSYKTNITLWLKIDYKP